MIRRSYAQIFTFILSESVAESFSYNIPKKNQRKWLRKIYIFLAGSVQILVRKFLRSVYVYGKQ